MLSSYRAGRRSWCRCKVRWMSTMLSNYREGSKFWCRCKGRWMKSNRSLSSLMMRGDNGELEVGWS